MAPSADKILSQTSSPVLSGIELCKSVQWQGAKMKLIYDFVAQFDDIKELATFIASTDGEHVAPRPVQPIEPARLGIEGDDTATDESTNPTLPPSPLSLAIPPLQSPPATSRPPPVSKSPRSFLGLPGQTPSIESERSSLFYTPLFQQSPSSVTSIPLPDSTTTHRLGNPFDHSFSDEPPAPTDDRRAAADQDTVGKHKPWYRRWGKTTNTIVAVAAFLFTVFSGATGWVSYNTAQDALKLQADAVHIASQQAAFQEWSVYKTFRDSCITFGDTSVVNKYCMGYIVDKPLLPPPVNEEHYYGASQQSRRRPQDGFHDDKDELSDTDDLSHFPTYTLAMCWLPILYLLVFWLVVLCLIFEELRLIQEFTLIWLAAWCAIAPMFPTPQETWVRKWLGSSRWDGLYLLTLTSILVGLVRLLEKFMKSQRMSLSVEIPLWFIACIGYPLIYIFFYEIIDKGGDWERILGYTLDRSYG